jgi:FkbM family methyltransferase
MKLRMIQIVYLKLRMIFLFAHPIRSLTKILKPSLNLSNIDKLIFTKYLDKVQIIIEAGAADGVDTMEFTSIFPNATIFAIEPVSGQFNHLKEKFKSIEHVKLHKLALDSVSGETEIYIGSNNGYLQGHGSSSLMMPTKHKELFPEIKFNHSETVQTQALYEFCFFNKISFVDILWLDLQGKEFDVISGSEEFIKSKVKLIHIELTRIQLYENMKTEKVVHKYMKSIGFLTAVDAVGAVSGNRLYRNSSISSR